MASPIFPDGAPPPLGLHDLPEEIMIHTPPALFFALAERFRRHWQKNLFPVSYVILISSDAIVHIFHISCGCFGVVESPWSW